MYPILTSCPVCRSELAATRLHCRVCDTTIEGRFEIGPFGDLTPEQLRFVEAFVRCEGKFTRLQDELGLSYPTLRNRLHEVMRAMGYEPGGASAQNPSDEQRIKILSDLESGRISAEAAMRQLRGGDEE